MTLTRFLTQLSLFTFCLAVLLAVLTYAGLLGSLTAFSWFCLAFFFGITSLVLSLAWLSKSSNSESTKSYALLGAMIFKFMLSILMVLAYAVLYKPSELHFLIPFFCFYLLFTFIGTTYLVKIAQSL